MEDFCAHFGGHLDSKIYKNWCRVWVCVRDDFLSGFKLVLGMFLEICWCQNDDQKAKGGFVEMLVLLK